jgi:hypothetical protein
MFDPSVFCLSGTEYLVMAYECYSHRTIFRYVSALIPVISKTIVFPKQLIQC